MKKKTIVVFDFDGTITKKDSLIYFIKFSKGKLKFYFTFIIFFPLLVAMKLKLFPNWKVKQLVFSFLYKGVPLEKFNNWGIAFSDIIDKITYHKAIETLKQHKKNGDKVIIISASLENYLKPWANKIGFDFILSTQIEVDNDNKITGNFSTKNCYGQEKVNRLLETFPDRNNYKLIAYGDSRGDKELIEFANESYYNKFSE